MSATKARVVCCEDHTHNLTLLSTALTQAGFWDCLSSSIEATDVASEDFNILIIPDFSYFSETSSTGTDPALVEGLIDLLHKQGYTNVVVGASQGSAV